MLSYFWSLSRVDMNDRIIWLYLDMGYSDDQLRQAVDAVFGQFDKDNSGNLDENETYALICAAMKHLDPSKDQPTQDDVKKFIAAVDKDGNGKIEKKELFTIFRKILPQWSTPIMNLWNLRYYEHSLHYSA